MTDTTRFVSVFGLVYWRFTVSQTLITGGKGSI